METKGIELFGRELLLSERYAFDVFEMIEFSREQDGTDPTVYMYQSAKVVESALKINIRNLKPYQFLKRLTYKRILSANNLLKKLSPKEIMELSKEVYKLEGYEETDNIKKKTNQKR